MTATQRGTFVATLVVCCLLSQTGIAQDLKTKSQPAYVGTWFVNAKQCKVTQDQEGAPLVVAVKRLDQHEAHCEFSSVQPQGAAGWTASTRCDIEGNKERRRIALKVKDGGLTVSWGDDVTTTYQKCPVK